MLEVAQYHQETNHQDAGEDQEEMEVRVCMLLIVLIAFDVVSL